MKILKPTSDRMQKLRLHFQRVIQNNRHVKHTDAHTKHKLIRTSPVNIRPEHKMVQEDYITTHTQEAETQSHI